ncbi:hypothetical protein Sango_2017500 [Sesamum angolense]|uniref:Uncharacterized protein n=1 Tax=Sesamum angolense TaxID=2727404 RepID=A0AAE1WFN6_9LAMI|nr:hypothetical protein Sango_2017500 [Sesamum angolense]
MGWSGIGEILSAVHGFNTGIPYVQNYEGPEMASFSCWASSPSNALCGKCSSWKLCTSIVHSTHCDIIYAASSASHYGVQLLTRHNEDDHVSRISCKELRFAVSSPEY